MKTPQKGAKTGYQFQGNHRHVHVESLFVRNLSHICFVLGSKNKTDPKNWFLPVETHFSREKVSRKLIDRY